MFFNFNQVKLFAFFVALFTFNAGLNAQQVESWCGTDGYNETLELSQKERQQASEFIDGLRKAADEFYQNGSNLTDFAKGGDDDVYIIPLVVHVIHDNGIGDISYEQILDGVRILNEDLRRQNADATQTRDVFKPHAADSKIEFRLAKIDPNGNCTNGVVRINDPYYAYNGNDNAKTLSVWPPDQYFNYWLANFLPTNGDGTLLGYARFPWWGVDNRYGVMQRNDQFGSIGTAAGNSGRTTVHEVGHCFGLYHTFQSGCGNNCSNSGDEICDTPPVSESSWACNSNLNTCSNDMNGPSPYDTDVPDQIENYMSYNSCQNMMSTGQAMRMAYVMEEITEIKNLWSPENLDATGVFLPDVLCEAEFRASKRITCVNNTINFQDMSFSNVTGWSWSFPGGAPEVSAEQNPTVTYAAPGTYEVSLTVSDGVNDVSEVKTAYITILPEGKDAPIMEGFEDYNALADSDWMFGNAFGTNSFELTSNVAYNGEKSVRLPNFGMAVGRINELISSPINMSEIPDEKFTLSYRYAYRKRSAGNVDWLRTYFTGNCGDSWIQVASRRGNQLSTEVVNVPWVPASRDEWVTVHISSISPAYRVDNFRMKFEFESDGGNNFFLDDINIYNGDPVEDDLSLTELGNLSNISIFPNPSNGVFYIDFSQEKVADVIIEIIDPLGKIVQTDRVNGQPGQNKVHIMAEGYDKGLYFVRISSSGQHLTTQKVVIK